MYLAIVKRIQDFLPICLVVIFYVPVSVVTADKNYYRAAVLEHTHFTDPSYTAAEIIQRNLESYEIAANTAGMEGADIIVFPEWGLYPHYKDNRSVLNGFVEDVPNPKRELSNPCNQRNDYKDRPILTKLSCLAKENSIFLVANMADKKVCQIKETCDRDESDGRGSSVGVCPEDGQFFYNTNVVFDREGFLVARYYKRHLYFELDLNTPNHLEDTYFETDFGNFTTFICFDLAFGESVEAVQKSGVSNVAYPTFWFDHTPLIYFATAFQQAWAMANKVNLLAANVHHPPTGTLGSGIYSAAKGALIYTANPDGRSKILISNVPKTVTEDTTDDFPLDAKRFVFENGAAVEVDVEEERNSEPECGMSVLGVPNDMKNLSNYRCYPSNTTDFNFVKLEGNNGNLEICSNGFCCSLSYEADTLDEEYFFGVKGKSFIFYDTFSYGSDLCLLSRCESHDNKPCMNYKLKSRTIFRRIELKGDFSTANVFPFAVDSDVRLTKRQLWSFDGKSRIDYRNPKTNSSLIFLGLNGRNFGLDHMMEST